MSVSNATHSNGPGATRELSDQARQRLEQSWAGTFYRDFFCRINAGALAALCAGAQPASTLWLKVWLGLEALKCGLDWSDEEMLDSYAFDLQVRYALGWQDLPNFDLGAVHDLRRRLASHWQATGENLVDAALGQIMGAPGLPAEFRAGPLRVDSASITQSICELARLQASVEKLQQLYQALSVADQQRYAALLAPWVQTASGQYIYPLKSAERPLYLRRVVAAMLQLAAELAPTFIQAQPYQTLVQSLVEHFAVEPNTWYPRADKASLAGGAQVFEMAPPENPAAGRQAVAAPAPAPLPPPPPLQADENSGGLEPSSSPAELPALVCEPDEIERAWATGNYAAELVALGCAGLSIYLLVAQFQFSASDYKSLLPLLGGALVQQLPLLLVLLKWPLLALAVVFIAWRAFWRLRFSRCFLYRETCPRCAGPIHRIPRVWWEYIFSFSLPQPIGRYICDNYECGWSALCPVLW